MRLVEPIDSLDDPRLAVYRNLKDRELARDRRGLFIAEGAQVVKRLLASDFPVESVLLAQRRVEQYAPQVPPAVPVYVVPDPLMHGVLGFKFHSGVIACGRRKPALTLDGFMSRLGERAILVVCPETNNTENLGAMMRICAGFGVDGMILGQHCCDPFYRQSIRVSMGSVFSLNLLQSDDLMRDLARLRSAYGVERIASVLDDSAEPLRTAQRSPRIAILFGNEAQGLPQQVIAECDRRITIPMKLGTDSLNVAVATGVFLYHFTGIEPR